MTVILGAGISDISASYHLGKKGIQNIIFEQDNDWGGLCGNFEIDGFRFDKAVHLSFSDNEYVKELFSKSCEYFIHKPIAYNYYNGYWLKHPAQNNLKPFSLDEKINIISDFAQNTNNKANLKNYEQWLKAQYGDYFSEHFAMVYTKKYWTLEAKDLSTTWVGNRMYKPNLKEVLKGAFENKTPNTYYASQMRYPKKGGYKSFLNYMRENCNIKFNKKVIQIDTLNKIVYFDDDTNQVYDNLISSIPLPEYKKIIKQMPSNIKDACDRLKYTSIALVSFGFNRPDVAKYLWFYIYDEDILASRCYSPSIKSIDNVPNGCSSLQFEIYFSKEKPLNFSNQELINHMIQKSKKMKIFSDKDIVMQDCRILKYGNVIFYHKMENDRKIILNYLDTLNIKTVGRFGKWEYLWSDQSLLSGIL
ncbi:nucleotidyl-sugar pyranose mutase [Campylobacter hyointestinalis subsp. hyointestinalis]|uniref:Nucleotidyl-sugar pyranose mutase n=1 Tax=Campylobacter hyointestinalis subsp. hyointestinalis TaxID=91352 RepID=A0A9W5F0I0_CAMHY|nr:FAD-dependent oxidoreductase [Campylobacter hyointestinalis]CUU70718.1 nucleotidyl-sugar pyranose mutase [Campylobacter hyointestinalis subsp. hyointestinalis]CUU70720.1 nucleotidyl-sugar pyranose mutase [Campylobacter hyointestinalis subsp. hyointestinalis]CUU85619.1 nucleotidyl-sugar pyranose mutase [Campylobacter hyointestinalis subsp. hyointestinalis]